jgi:DNA-binding LacI/PurR family transcriptional regulator
MGLIAAQKIEKAIENKPIENQLLVEPVKLIIRSSSMRI